jgi:homoserine kinase type II
MAVYTEVADEELEAFVADYRIGRVIACKGIAEGIENSNFLLVTDQGTFILTLYEKRVRPADLPFFLALMEHLANGGIPCPTPVRGRDGEALRRLAGRHAAIVTFLRGMWPRRPSAEHCAALGQALARMHVAGLDFPLTRANDLSVKGWRPLFEACVRQPDRVAADLVGELDQEISALERDWPTGLPSGVIHADLFPDNVFFEGGQLSGLIDFYFACTDSLAYDVAVCLNAWCFEADGSFNVTKARRLVGSYQATRPLGEEELGLLPVLARGAAMRFLLTRLYDWMNTPKTALVTPKNPMEYIQKSRFHRGVRDVRGYGLDGAGDDRSR